MKFLALFAISASALTLRTTSKARAPEDIVQFFLDSGSADGFMKALDANKDGEITEDELDALLKAKNADADDIATANGIFKSMSQGRPAITKADAENWEAGIRLLLK